MANINGTNNNDYLVGTATADLINGFDGDDELLGAGGNDTLNGGNGHDILRGEDGNDILNGGAGEDYLNPGPGVDQVNGGDDYDGLVLNFSTSATAITINYTTTTNGTISNGSTFREIEVARIDGSSKPDNINMSAAGNTWTKGGGGNDTVRGGTGIDRLEGENGSDILRGGDGDDGGYQGIFFWGVGFPGDFSLQYYGGLYGGAGNDQIFGEAGSDLLFGEAGDDKLDGGSGDDYLEPGDGINQIDGGLDTDGLVLNFSAATAPVTITYTTPINGTISTGTTFRNIEFTKIDGSSGADNFNLSATTNNWIESGGGNDIVRGGTDIDLLKGGNGDDVLRGGAGDERDSFIWPISFPGQGLFLTFYGGIYGGAGNDRLYGDAGSDMLFGEDGNDVLNGGIGEDYLEPGDGVDQVIGGFDRDGVVFDFSTKSTDITVTYTTLANGTVSNGSTFSGIEVVRIIGGLGAETIDLRAADNAWVESGAGNDNVRGSKGTDRLVGGNGNDTLRGGNGDDKGFLFPVFFPGKGLFLTFDGGIYGGAGNDRLFGDAGNDWLYGEDGNDILNGGEGDDYLEPGSGINQSVIGGAGWDTLKLDFSQSTTAITINYTDPNNGTISNGSTFKEIEVLDVTIGYGADKVTLTAITGNTTVRSGYGNDTLIGGQDRDEFFGGFGNDILWGGNGNESSSIWVNGGLYGEAGNDTLYGEAGWDHLEGGDGNDILDGGLDDDGLLGQQGADRLIGGGGNDSLTGGTQADQFIYDTGVAFVASDIGIDRIEDFTKSELDKIVLDKTTFTALTSVAGNGFSQAGEFAVVNSDTLVETSVALIVYNSATGSLFYNQNGSAASLGTGSQFATLITTPALAATDFVLQA